MEQKPAIDNVISISCKRGFDFYKYWLVFLKPFHNLTDKELGVAAALLMYRHELSKSVSDENILDKVVVSRDTYDKIKADQKLSASYLEAIKYKLRKSKFIVDGKINRRLIPNLKEDKSSFSLLFSFNLLDDTE